MSTPLNRALAVCEADQIPYTMKFGKNQNQIPEIYESYFFGALEMIVDLFPLITL